MTTIIYGYFFINIALFIIMDMTLQNGNLQLSKEESNLKDQWDINKFHFLLFIMFFGLPLLIFSFISKNKGP